MNALAKPNSAAPSKACETASPERMAAAIQALGPLKPVTEYSRLISPEACDRVIANADAHMTPCSRDQASSLVAQLIHADPGLALDRRDDERERSFQAYALKLHEAFCVFSYAVGLQIVHGGTGVPATVPYRPKPSDVRATGDKIVGHIRDAKTMAQRHKAEAQRRENQRAEQAERQKSCGTAEQRKARVAALMAEFRRATERAA